MNRFLSLFSGVIIAFVVVAACQQHTNTPPSRSETMAQTILGDSGIFRGHQMGEQLSNIAKKDRDYLMVQSSDELRYSIPFSTTDSIYFDLLYAFQNSLLYEIQVDILLNFAPDSLFREIKSTLTERYGKPHERGEYAFWEITQQSRDLEISLRDESAMRGRPCLSLNFFEPQIFVH